MGVLDYLPEDQYEALRRKRRERQEQEFKQLAELQQQPGIWQQATSRMDYQQPENVAEALPQGRVGYIEPERPDPWQTAMQQLGQAAQQTPFLGPVIRGAQGLGQSFQQMQPEATMAPDPAPVQAQPQRQPQQPRSLLDEIGDIARQVGLDEDGSRVARAIAQTEGALNGEIGDTDLPGGRSVGPFQFYGKYGMLPAYAQSLGMTEDQAAEYARKMPTEAARWALGGYLGQAIKEGQAKGLRGADLATYAQTHGQRSQSPERAGQNYAAMFDGQAQAPSQPVAQPQADPWQAAMGQLGQWGQAAQENIPGVGGLADAGGKALEGMQWLKENVGDPSAQVWTGSLRNDQWRREGPHESAVEQGLGRLAKSAQEQGLGEGWRQQGQEFRESTPITDWDKPAASMIFDPLNLPFLPGPEVAIKGAQLLGKAATKGARAAGPAVRRAGELAGQGANAYFDAARQVPVGMTVEDVGKGVNRLTANAADLAADYKARGMDKYRAWDQFIIDRALKPEMDAKVFYKTYDQVSASAIPTPKAAPAEPTHIIRYGSGNERRVKIVEDTPGFVRWVDEYGSTGSDPKLAEGHIKSIEPITAPTAPPPAQAAAKQPWERTAGDINAAYPRVGDTVDGRQVGESIPNQSSIDASVDNPTVLNGIREVPIAAFEDSGPPKFSNPAEQKRTERLAEQIRQSGRIDPLIVVDDGQSSPYILEGGHRFDALKLLGAKSFPAKVVVDEDAYYTAVKQAISEGRAVPPEVLAEYPDLAKAAPATPPVPEPKPALTEPPIEAGAAPIPEGTSTELSSSLNIEGGTPEVNAALRQKVADIEQKAKAGRAAIDYAAQKANEALASGITDPEQLLKIQNQALRDALSGKAEMPLSPSQTPIKEKGKTTPKDLAEQAAETAAEEQLQNVGQGDVTPPRVPVAADVPPTPPEGPLGTLTPPSKPDSWLSGVKPTSEILDMAYREDWPRKLADANPTLGKVMQRVGVPLRSVPVQGRVIHESIKADWNSGLVGAVARLRSQGDSQSLFKVDKDGLATVGTRKVALNDVLEYPGRYNLTPEQKSYAETLHRLYDDSKDILAAEGIEIKELGFEEGGHYVGRRVLGKVDGQGNIELGIVAGSGGKRIGGRSPFEKGREFATQAEALQEGFRYLTPEEALQANLQAAGKKIADKRLADFILANIPYRTGAAPEELKLARDFAQKKLGTVGNLKAVINRGYRGERVPMQTVTAIGKYFPDQAKLLVEAGITKPEDIIKRATLQQAEASLRGLRAQASSDYYRAVNKLAKASEEARRPRYGESAIQTPAFQGKFFAEKDASEIRKMLDLEPKGKLRSGAEIVAWANSLPRLLMTTMDIGGATIQLQIIGFSHPTVWAKSVKQGIEALASDKGYQTFLATHADTVKKWSAEGAIFTPSEFTAAAAPGGPLSKMPVLGIATKPFVRSWEAMLNAGKVYGLEATEHMAKTPEEMRDLATFWNEVTGVVNTGRQGLSPTQQAVETALLFAPRYNRAILALLTDVFKGGLRGKMARESLGKAIVAGLAGYVGISYALGQQPHLDPREGGKFLTIEVAGQRLGLGGAFVAATRTLAQIALDPGKAHEYAGRFLQSRVSPAVGLARDLAPHVDPKTGRVSGPQDFMGQSIDTLPKLTKRIFADNLLPIWAQAFTEADGDWTGASLRAGAEFGGLRSFPTSPAERRDAARERAAKELFPGKAYADLDAAQKGKVDAAPEVARLKTAATKTYAERGSPYHEYQDRVAKLRAEKQAQIEALGQQLQDGTIDKGTYNQEVAKRRTDMATLDDIVATEPAFAEALAEIKKRREQDPKSLKPVDVFLDDYYRLTEKLTDPKTGAVNLNKLIVQREELKQRTDPDVAAEALKHLRRFKTDSGAMEVVKVGDKDKVLSTEQSAEVRQRADEAADAGLRYLLASELYREAPGDKNRRALIERVTTEAKEMARDDMANALAKRTGLHDLPRYTRMITEFVDALDLKYEYDSMPLYEGIAKKDEKTISTVRGYISQRSRNLGGNTAKAKDEAYKKFGKDAFNLYYQATQLGSNPKRKEFWRKNKLLQKWFSSAEPDMPDEELEAAS